MYSLTVTWNSKLFKHVQKTQKTVWRWWKHERGKPAGFEVAASPAHQLMVTGVEPMLSSPQVPVPAKRDSISLSSIFLVAAYVALGWVG